MSTVAVIQSNYLPWKGYFDIIRDVDTFVFYDDVQYTTEDWRNRNRIKGHQGPQWLTVPVGAHARHQLIDEVELSAGKWATNHWKTLQQYYGRAPHFKRYAEFFQHAYLERRWTRLSELNQFLITAIARDFLGLNTTFRHSRELAPEGARLDRLIDLLGKAEATRYVSGPSAKRYIDPACFEAAGIDLVYKDYAGYPIYPQPHGPFEHAVSIVDLLFNVGPESPHYIWGWRAEPGLTAVVPQADLAPSAEAAR
ncbi:MAG: WbqC family protein [Candidatus Sericytochromatia bacterium]